MADPIPVPSSPKPATVDVGPLPPTLFGAALLAQLGVHFLLPVTHLLPGAWRAVGLLPLAIGLALNVRESSAFEHIATPIHPFARPQVLRTTGAFARTRNPMYLGMLLALAGVALLLGTLSPWLVIPLLAAVLHARFIRREEATLTERFGGEYEAYRGRVRRWL